MRIIVLAIITLIVSACGGGGGGDSGSPPPTADNTPPAAPTVSLADNSNGTLSVSGSAEANSSIRVTFPDGTTQTTSATASGGFGPLTSSVPQRNGTVASTATDSAGNTSATTRTTYTDVAPPQSPTLTISSNSNGTISINGTAEANSSIRVTFPDGSERTGLTSSQGTYGPVISTIPQINGTVGVTSTDVNGNSSAPSSTPYSDIIAPPSATFTLTVEDDNRITINGSAEVESVISVTFEDGSTGTDVTNLSGTFGPITSSTAQVTGDVDIVTTDRAGNDSDVVSQSYTANFIPENELFELVNDNTAKDVVRFLTQATFGPTEDTIQRLIADEANYEAWIDEQIALPATNLLNTLDGKFSQAGLPISRADIDQFYQKQLLGSDVFWETFAYGEDQLRQRVAFALSQIFVISETSDTLFNNSRGVAAYHDLLASHAFGNFRDLLQDVTLNPMMGEYLSMIRNEKANIEQNIRPDENYARELMQLFSIGLVMLNQDGSVQTDGDGQPIPTYDQDIIKAFARVFTGWTYNNANSWYYDGWLFGDTISPMKAYEFIHDTDEKTLLNGEVLPAGQTALADLEGALDNIFNHENVAPFISKQLIQRLVTSNPSPAYISRISSVFSDNGEGVRGDLGAVVKAILLDQEARTGHLTSAHTFGKLKEPILKFTALIRAFNVQGSHPVDTLGNLQPTLRFFWPGIASGQKPYGSPSVFNFYRPDHSPAGSIRDSGLVAPETQILNEYYITEATNYGSAIVFHSYDFLLTQCQNRIGHLDGFGCPYPDFSAEIAIANNTAQLMDRLNLLLFAGEMSTPMEDALVILAGQQSEPRFVVAEVVHLMYISPEFSVQR